MSEFYIRKISPEDAPLVIEETGFDKFYIPKAVDKYNFLLLKIHNLIPPQSSIIKQLALSVGTDAAVHREVITCKVDKSDILLGGSVSQLKKIAEKLGNQPFKLKFLAEEILNQLVIQPTSIKVRNTVFDWNKKTYIMGILNVTPDSFSDGGSYIQIKKAFDHAMEMIEDGVDIIDVGGESTRPFAEKVSVDEELNRVLPIIQKIREFNSDIPISIDTRNSRVANEAVRCGADIINDVSGFDWDENMVNIAAQTQVPIIIMHSLADPETMQVNPEYNLNVVDTIFKSLSNKVKFAQKAGIKKENIILDPGIGFGKTLEHNIEIIQRINEFTSVGCPLLIGISRKSIISKIVECPPSERDEPTLGLNTYLASNGVNIIRVHDVKKHSKTFKIIDKIIRK